jgi:glycosyltransferase involved in cell wall biosynthesis
VDRVDRVDQSRVSVVRDSEFGYPVHRLSVSAVGLQKPLTASYHTGDIQHAVERILDAIAPDVLHLHGGYLLGAAVLAAARRRNLPTLVTLHDFWFICPRLNLVHPSGAPCSGPESAAKCAWCLATEQRRYRMPDAVTGNRLGRIMIKVLQHNSLAPLMNLPNSVQSVATRHRVLSEALAHADAILAPANFVRDHMVRAGIPAERILVSRLGVELRPVKRRDRMPGDPLRVGYLGQLAPHKGVHLLIEAVQRLPAANLTVRIYGDPAPHPRYVQHLKGLSRVDGRITFPGPYRHNTVYDILAELDVIVVPSVCYETGPLVIQEAQAAQVPAIASRLGGPRELVVEEQNGLLFEAGNAHDLASQLRRVLDSPSLLEQLRPDSTSVRTADDEMRELRGHYERLRH